MNKFVKTSVALLTLCGCLSFASIVASSGSKETLEVVADNKMISGDSFVSVDNFAYSDKGFVMEFTFTKPSKDTTVTYSFMNVVPGAWNRLTKQLQMTFKTSGTVTATVGHIIEIDGTYFYQLMCSDLLSYLNKDPGEVRDGTETLNGMFFPSNDVSFECVATQKIETGMTAYPASSIREDINPGLTFKAYIPKVESAAKYGMMIVPSSYLKGAENNYKKYFKDNNIEFLDLECNPNVLTTSDPIYKTFGSGYYIQGSIVNIADDNYQVPFVSIPYFELDGKTIYGNLIRYTKNTYYENCLSFKSSEKYQTASDSLKDEINRVIYKSEHHATKVSLGSDIKAYFPYNTEKIFKNASLPDTLVTENVMYCAKNESERGQVIINVPSSFSKKYFATIDPFVNVEDQTQVISKDNIKIEQQLYQNVTTNWSVGGSQPKGWYPENSGPNNNLPLGYTPDALLPFDVAFDANENILTGQNGSNNALSYTVNVPKNVKSGEYKSKIVIKVSGEGTLALPISLHVFDFNLPDENKAKYAISVSTSETKALYGNNAGDISSIYNQSAYEVLRDRGISGGLIPATCWAQSNISDFIKKAKEYASDPKIGVYYLPNPSEEVSMNLAVQNTSGSTEYLTLSKIPIYRALDTNYDATTVLPGIKTQLRELIKASTNELDLLKKAVYYYPQADEPGNSSEKHIQNVLCENVVRRCVDELLLENLFSGKNKVKESLQNLAYIVTSYPRGLMKNINNINYITPDSGYEQACANCYCDSADAVKYTKNTGYCPTYDSYQYDAPYNKNGSDKLGYQSLMSMKNDPEYTLWWYSCIQPITPYPCEFVNANLIQKRVNEWTKYCMGIEGELYYMCNRTQRYMNSTSIPLTEDLILKGEAYYEGAYGDGLLIYAAHQTYREYDQNLYWLSSLRLDAIAEGIDDYNYIAYVDEMIKSLSDVSEQEYYDTILYNLLNSVGDGPGKNTTDHEYFFNQRIALGNLVEEISKK